MESDLFYVGLKVQILRFFGPFRKTAGMLCRNHQRKNGKRPLAPFWSKSQLVLCLYNISHFSAGDSTLLMSGKRTNGRPLSGIWTPQVRSMMRRSWEKHRKKDKVNTQAKHRKPWGKPSENLGEPRSKPVGKNPWSNLSVPYPYSSPFR